MALDFETIEQALKDWFTTVLDLPCQYENNRQAMLGKLPVYGILGEPTDIDQVGEDYVSGPFSGDDWQPGVIGSREFTCMIRIIGRSHTSARSARHHAEILRTSLKKPSILEFFQSQQIAIVRASPIQNFDATFDSRVESIAAFDLRLCAPLAESLDSPVGTIGTIELSSTVKNADGTTLPVPPNLDDELIGVDP